MTGQNEEKRSLRGLSFDEQLKLSGFERISRSNQCMRLGDIAHDSDPGWQNLFQAKIDSAQKDGFRAYVLHKGDWHGYYESKTKECSMGICNCGKERSPSPRGHMMIPPNSFDDDSYTGDAVMDGRGC